MGDSEGPLSLLTAPNSGAVADFLVSPLTPLLVRVLGVPRSSSRRMAAIFDRCLANLRRHPQSLHWICRDTGISVDRLNVYLAILCTGYGGHDRIQEPYPYC